MVVKYDPGESLSLQIRRRGEAPVSNTTRGKASFLGMDVASIWFRL